YRQRARQSHHPGRRHQEWRLLWRQRRGRTGQRRIAAGRERLATGRGALRSSQCRLSADPLCGAESGPAEPPQRQLPGGGGGADPRQRGLGADRPIHGSPSCRSGDALHDRHGCARHACGCGLDHRSFGHRQRGPRFHTLSPANFATKPRSSGGAFLLHLLLLFAGFAPYDDAACRSSPMRIARLVLAALLATALPLASVADVAPGTVQPFAKNDMIAAANPLAAEAGLEMLRAGGSAVDAAIAVQMVLGLVEPESSGIGGGAFMLVYNPK